ncbi:urea ABC transporter ATP-binding subunit UrtE [Agitococcus lubricus]|uniref:Amino acid/amide ABC transporter ATP-binding protein 2 (HAAT family) n=1 Tax=Agitococcus lubricus TaxID=1077255 RepID=A0A2T5IYA5_9GAMM|nr:urea ABC transporter ATP-binding subunit UrtE [Agitococcus lubricus]PTQ88953.1 amino acid/amide ABC transporter ATP-binding protein 2 (HAAT family) [Agitococcus lubricus]
MLRIEGLNQFYGQSHILWDIDLKIRQGSCACLMGRNGVGKTTFLKCVMGLLPHKTGEVWFDNQNLNKYATEQRARLGIGYVPQGREIFPLLTVEENLKIALSGRKDKLKHIPSHIYDMFPVLKDMRQRRGGDLSGGQQQQLAIGRALVLDPKLLILDEPTEGIQPNIVKDIGEVIRKLNHQLGITVLLVEQKLPFARAYATDFHILNKGRLVAEGEISQLTDDIVQAHLSV